MAEPKKETETTDVLVLKTSPEIEKVLVKQMSEIPKLALERTAEQRASVFGLIVCCVGAK
jgi:hypothetical protein